CGDVALGECFDGALLQGVESGVVEDGGGEDDAVERGLGGVAVAVVGPSGANDLYDGASGAADGVYLVGVPDIGHDDAVAVCEGRVDPHEGGANPEVPVAFADAGAEFLQESAYAGVVVLGGLPAEGSDELAKLPAAVDQWVDLQRRPLKFVGESDALVAEGLQGFSNGVFAAALLACDADEGHGACVAHGCGSFRSGSAWKIQRVMIPGTVRCP